MLAEASRRAERDIEAATRARARRPPPRGRRPDDPRDREGHAQDAHRRRPAPARRARRSASSTSRRSPRRAASQQLMEELAQVYARSLFEVAREQRQARRAARAARPVRRRARRATASSPCSSSRPTSPPRRSSRRCERLLERSGRAARELPATADREAPHAGDLPHPPRVRAALGRGEPGCCRSRSRARSSSTQPTTENLGRTIGERAGRKVTLAAHVDPEILGGIIVRVGNSILDASIRNRLEQLRRHVAQGAA